MLQEEMLLFCLQMLKKVNIRSCTYVKKRMKGRNRPRHALKYNHPLNHSVNLVDDFFFFVFVVLEAEEIPSTVLYKMLTEPLMINK